ncbi:MAG: cobalamin-binding protein [Pseudomonadales bacterium]|nr:cobalamin-binding protein [Pseudomonadales bacterium]
MPAARLQIWFGLFLLLAAPAGWAAEVQDDSGQTVGLEQAAERIISLAPSLTELLFAAGAGDKVIAVVEYSDYPKQARSLPRIGRHDLLDMERIVQLQPDLIVAWQSGNPRASIRRLQELGMTVYSAEPKSLDSIPSHIERLGILAGSSAIADQASDNFRGSLAALRSDYSHKSPVRTFYQVWNLPLITAGGNELINDIISLCGGENIFAELSMVAPKVSTEAVITRNPQAIVASGMDIERPEWLDDWLRWPNLDAVSAGNLFFIPPDYLQRHTPRALEGARQMCQFLDQARSH